MNGKRHGRGIGFYLIVFLVLLGTIGVLMNPVTDSSTALTYSDVTKLFEDEQVTSFTISGHQIQLVLKDGSTAYFDDLPSEQTLMDDIGDTIRAQREAGTLQQNYKVETVSFFETLLPYLIILVLFGAFWFFLMNRQGGGAGAGNVMNFGKSRAKLAGPEEQKRITFRDVAGADEEKADLEEVVEFLRDPKKFMALGARIPKGVLLVGPPGTGKTLIAKAVAGEAGVPFFSISGSDFVELYVGVGASRVRDLFNEAKKHAPAIVFIDEIDAVGRQRGAGLGGGHDEREQTLNQLLVEMDGFGNNAGVIVLAATNRADILDPALLRPGRFDRQIYIGVPDIKGREEILKVHARKKPLADDVDLGTIARSTVGFTGADLENLLNEAALLAARRNRQKIALRDIDDAFLKVIMGNEKKSRIVTEHERRLTAYHEAGHALTSRLLPTQDPVQQVSIVPRGRAGGFTLNMPKEDKYYMSKRAMEDELVVLLGGRAAEKLVMEDISTGASNDIERASEIARKMVTKYGMSERIGPIAFGSAHDEVFLGRDFTTSKNLSDATASEIDEEVRRFIDEAYERCLALLKENRATLDRLAAFLLKHETMDNAQLEAIFEGKEPAEKPRGESLVQPGTIEAPEEQPEGDAGESPTDTAEAPADNAKPAAPQELPPEGKPGK